MKSIYTKNDYQILVDVEKRRACIVKGSNHVHVSLEELTPLSSLAAKHLRMMGCDPKKYLNIGHTNQVILRDAAPAWEEAVAASLQVDKKNNTCMIPMFLQNLTGLLELREAEDTYAACQKSASLMLEYQQRGLPPAQLMDLRRKYPRAAAYVLAEAYAFSPDDRVAQKARRAMHILLTNGDIREALDMLPQTPPDAFGSDQLRSTAV
ncbi:hypothetical protein [Geobacter sp. DSM 9736]|uniref:hypothetical protein n=1 Tax=Geobacter sp. DSM 9736 TaxID=1277350 RepID=UPI000B50D957|nr:hypothetical protein [Geobacter sp. DSM 9736]SNB46797.1 hypothetical protein SAMN06269301_2267 [Geobacter sp. DSM 9736]